MKTRMKTKEAARGKWNSILGHLGYVEVLDGKHHDCPICSAKKKFRYTDYQRNGEWICTCGAGDGFDLIMACDGVGFNVAAKLIDEVLGNNDLEEVFKPEIDYEKRRRDLNKLWAQAVFKDLVYEYLHKVRGIEHHDTYFRGLTDLRGHNAMYNADTGKRQPGMLALIRNSKGAPVSIHRTFFDPKAKKVMPPTEKISGAGVRLGWTKNHEKKHLVIGEGIETTVMGMSAARVPGLAAISAHGMETLVVPKIFQAVTVLADNDRSYTGQRAAFTLARRLDAEKRDVRVIMSEIPGHDYLDTMAAGYKEDFIIWDNCE